MFLIIMLKIRDVGSAIGVPKNGTCKNYESSYLKVINISKQDIVTSFKLAHDACQSPALNLKL